MCIGLMISLLIILKERYNAFGCITSICWQFIVYFTFTDLYLWQLYKVHNIKPNFDDTVLLHSTTGLADIFVLWYMKCWLLFVASVHIQNEYMDWMQMCFRHVLFLPCIKPRSSLFRRQKLSFSLTGTAVPTRNWVLPQRDRATRCVSGNLCQLLHNCRNKLYFPETPSGVYVRHFITSCASAARRVGRGGIMFSTCPCFCACVCTWRAGWK